MNRLNVHRVVLWAMLLVSTLIGSLNCYVLSKWKFRGSETLFAFMLFGVFMPMQVVLLPMSQVLGWLGMASSVWGLMLVHVVAGIPSSTLFFRNDYIGLPDELIKAAQLDGAGFGMIYRRIVLPLSLPIVVVTLIWQFTNIWIDEPLSNLDAKLRVEMRAEIKLLHQRTQTTTVYVTHDQVEAMTLGDRIAVMKDGLVQQFGTPAQIYNHPANRFVAEFIGSPAMNMVDAQRSGNALTAHGVALAITDAQCAAVRAHLSADLVYGLRPRASALPPKVCPASSA